MPPGFDTCCACLETTENKVFSVTESGILVGGEGYMMEYKLAQQTSVI